MLRQIETFIALLKRFSKGAEAGTEIAISRELIVAHAALSALAHHWPSPFTKELQSLLEETKEIKAIEHSRWAVQRRIAIAKLAAEIGISGP